MSRYRTTLLLVGLVLAGWVWDFALGGGGAHAVGWLIALVLVGGISLLSASRSPSTSRIVRPDVPDSGPKPATSGRTMPEIRVMELDDVPRLIEVERSADTLFEVAGYGCTPGPADAADLSSALLVLVAGRSAVGYVRLSEVDDCAHVESLSVIPSSMKQGVGTALLEAAADWASAAGYPALTLTAFADVDWNGPFYRRRGFVELTELTPELAAIRAAERASGLDDLAGPGPRGKAAGRRIAMHRPL